MRKGRALLAAAAAWVVVLVGCGQPVHGLPGGTSPAKADRFVELGTITARIALDPAELGTSDAQSLATALERAQAQHLDQAQDALAEAPEPGERGFAFVLIGCAETDAVLHVSQQHIDAELTGGENINCAAPVYFLATFTVDADQVPAGARLGGR